MPRTPGQAAGFLIGLWLAIVLLQPLGARADQTDPALAALESALHQDINAVRSEHHLIELRRIPELDAVASAHSHDMATRHYMSHDTPEGLNPVDRIARSGFDGFSLAGENVGMTSLAPPNREIVQGWLHSPVHRDNVLAPAFNATGIGIARASDGSFYYTQLYVTLPRR